MIDKLHLTITGRVLKATETLYSGESVIVEIEDSGLVPLNAADYRLILFGADKSILAASQPFAANAATWTATLDTATEAFQTYYANVNASVSKTLGMMIVNDNTGDTICAGTIGAVSVPFPMQLNTIPDLYADSFIQRTEAQSLLADAVAGLNAAKMAKVAAAVEDNAAVFDSAGSVKDSGLKLVRRSVGNGSSIGVGNVSGVADYEKVVAIGDSGSAYGDNAVAVGMDSTVDGNGVAVGCSAHAAGQNTVAIGHRAIDEDADNCVLIGANASINLGCGGGVAIGKDAHISADSESDHYEDGAGNSVALGRNARIFGAANAVQLGEGTNTAPGTLQFRSFPVMDADGHIAPDAVAASSIADGAVTAAKIADLVSLTVGTRTGTVGNGSLANGQGNGATGNFSHAEGCGTMAGALGSHASGFKASVAGAHQYAFAWNGDAAVEDFASNGPGTFNVNPAPVGQGETDPASGFFIGSESLKTRLDGKLDALLPVEWADLVSLRNGGNLVPGRQYRIVDYAASTSQENTRVAEYEVDGETHVGHRFDLIVIADAPDRLNECARAIAHDGELPDDTVAEVDGETVRTGYFANSRLGAWRVWYCLDNDTARFGWADVQTGHGVIYRLIDEFGNDCPYDFKNIEFRRWKISAYTTADYTSEETAGNKYYLDNLVGVPLLPSASNMVLKKEYGSGAQPFLTLTNGGESEWRGTFSGNALSGQTFNVAIGGAGTRLPDNVFMQGEVHDIRLGTNNWGNTFQGKTFYLDFGPDCQYVMARGQCNYLRLGCGCGYVLLYCDASGFGNVGTIGDASGHILMIQTYGSSIGEYCAGIRLGVGSHGNTVGNQCADIVIGRRRLHDHNNEVCGGMAHVGIEGAHNWIGGMTAGSGTGCIEIDGSGNVFGVNCASVQFTGSYSSFGSDCRNIRASGAAANTGIVFGNGCHDISFGSVSDGGNGEEFIPDGNFRNVEFGPGVANVSLHCTGDTSSASYQNVSVLSGVHDKAIVDSNVGQEFHTVYQPADSVVHSV